MSDSSMEPIANKMKEMLASAVALGMAVSDKKQSGELYDVVHLPIVTEVNILADSVDSFIKACQLEAVSVDEVLPLHREISIQLSTRAS